MTRKLDKKLATKLESTRIEEELEEKFFPHTHEKKKQERAMKNPELFETQLKEKLRKCLVKK
jgi:hypothetical protein